MSSVHSRHGLRGWGRRPSARTSRFARVGAIASILALAVGLAPAAAADAEPGTATVSGEVHVPEGAEPFNGQVVLHPVVEGVIRSLPSHWIEVEGGKFSQSGIAPATYVVEFVDNDGVAPHYIPQWLGEDENGESVMTEDLSAVVYITLSAGDANEFTGEMRTTGGVIAGTITDGVGNPLRDACVLLVSVSQYGEYDGGKFPYDIQPMGSFSNCSNAAGEYVSQAVPDGEYYLKAIGWTVNGVDGTDPHFDRWYGADTEDDWPSVIKVESGASASDIDVVLERVEPQGYLSFNVTVDGETFDSDVTVALVPQIGSTGGSSSTKIDQSWIEINNADPLKYERGYGTYYAVAFDTSGYYATTDPVRFEVKPENTLENPVTVPIELTPNASELPATPSQASGRRFYIDPDGDVKVSWQPSAVGASVDHYNLTAQPVICYDEDACEDTLVTYRYSDDEQASYFTTPTDEASTTVTVDPQPTDGIVTGRVGGLDPGKMYRIFVTAIDGSGNESVPLLVSFGVYGVSGIDSDKAQNYTFNGSETGTVSLFAEPTDEGEGNFAAPAVEAQADGNLTLTAAPLTVPEAGGDTPSIPLEDSTGTFVDLSLGEDDNPTGSTVSPTLTGLGEGATGLMWWDASDEPGNWKPVTGAQGDVEVADGTASFTIGADTSPSIDQLTGTIFAATGTSSEDPDPDDPDPNNPDDPDTFTVTGKVTDSENVPVADAQLDFYSDEAPDDAVTATTGSDGSYSVSLPVGTYTGVLVSSSSSRYLRTAYVPLDDIVGATTDLDFQLQVGASLTLNVSSPVADDSTTISIRFSCDPYRFPENPCEESSWDDMDLATHLVSGVTPGANGSIRVVGVGLRDVLFSGVTFVAKQDTNLTGVMLSSTAHVVATGVTATLGSHDVEGKQKATVSWAAPTDFADYTVDHYRVTAFDGAKVFDVIDSSELSADVAGLTPGHKYTFSVAPIYQPLEDDGDEVVGPESAVSNAVTAVAVLDAASQKSAEATDADTPAIVTGDSDSIEHVTAQASGGKGKLVVTPFATNPAGAPNPTASPSAPTFDDDSADYFDVYVDAPSGGGSATFQTVEVKRCNLTNHENALFWWNPQAGDGGAWQSVSPTRWGTGADANCLIATITNTSSPTIAQLTGTMFALAPAVEASDDDHHDGGPGPGASGEVSSGPETVVTDGRVAGRNRFATAAEAALQFAAADSDFVGNIVVANAEDHKNGFDALSANVLAASVHAPLLLTSATALPPDTADAIAALVKGHSGASVTVMGGVDSVSEAVIAQIKAAAKSVGVTVTVSRVAGSNRYATSAKAALQAGIPASIALTKGSPSLRTAFLASGEVNADAVAASAASNGLGVPVLLTASGALSPEVAKAIITLGVKQVVILGGPERVSDAVVAELGRLGVTSTKRIRGHDRFDTSAQLYALLMSSFDSPGSTAYLANGMTGWPDALAVGPLAGATGAPLLTVPLGTLPDSVRQFLAKSGFTGVVALGTTQTVSSSVLLAAQEALN